MHYTLKKILSSLASKILACVTLSFLLIFAGTRFIANVLGERVQKQTVDLFVCKIDNYCKELALELQGCESYISATSDVLQAIIQKKEELSVLESTINRWIQDQISDISGKGFVAGVGIWSVPEERARHPGEPEATYYSISRRRLFAYDELSKLAGGDYDYTRRPWYLDMLGDMKKNSGQPRKVFWSLPYRSLTTPQRDYFISLGTGLYYRDKDSEREKLAAMFVYDIYLESLIKGVELYQKETEASVLLISQRMNAILFEKYAYDLLLEDAAVDEDKASYWLKQ